MSFVAPGAVCKRTWGDMQAHLSRDAFASGSRRVRIWAERRSHLGRGAVANGARYD